jgi:tetratricopeptide (TPR) repeat protein
MEAQNERKAGQLPAAKTTLEKALAIDPKLQGAPLLLMQINYDLGAIDDVVKVAKADVAADASNKDRDAALLLQLGQQAYKAAATSKKVDDYKRAITLLAASDEISPSPAAKFFEAYSAFTAFTTTAADLPKSKSCPDARAAREYLTTAQTQMPGGGSYNAAAAQQVLGALPDYQKYIDQAVKAYCK